MTDDFLGWEARPELQSSVLVPERARALAATLDIDVTNWVEGQALPVLWQWIYFTPEAPASQIGEDGHPRRGGFLPPVELPRRMFAGGRTRLLQPLVLGLETERVAEIKGISRKAGANGPLVFVQVRYEYRQRGETCIDEVQDIVYRGAGDLVPSPVPADAVAVPETAWTRTIEPNPVLLFRFSALTFNSHRIHYDRSYAIEQEGYPGLVVHGPLVAILLADLVRRHDARDLVEFSFRAKAPLFDKHPFQLIATSESQKVGLIARGPDGKTAIEAEATFASVS